MFAHLTVEEVLRFSGLETSWVWGWGWGAGQPAAGVGEGLESEPCASLLFYMYHVELCACELRCPELRDPTSG